MSRIRFFPIRLAISAALLLLVYGVVRTVWYPGAYYGISGAAKQFWILAGVVFVTGPVLTTLVWRPGKKGMKFDLVALGGLELVVVLVAATVLYLRQPYFTVFAVDRFEALSRQEVVEFSRARTAFGSRPWREPRLVFASLPEDPERMQTLIDETIFGGMADIDRRPEFWAPYASGVASVKEAARPLSDLADFDEKRARAIKSWLSASDRPAGAFVFLPLRGKRGEATVVLDAAVGYPVATLAVDPWPSAPQDGEPSGDIEQAHE